MVRLLRRSRVSCVHLLAALAPCATLGGAAWAQNVRLSGPLTDPGSADVVEYVLAPDGARVAYRADQEQENVFEAFSAPLDGSAPAVKVSAPLVLNGDV